MELPEQAFTLLKGRYFAVLATSNPDGSIHQSVVWYLLEYQDDGDVIIMNTVIGRVEEQNMRRDPRISVCVGHARQYVTISGKVELVDAPEIAQEDIYRLAVRYDGEASARRQMGEQFSKEARVSLRLKCEKVIEYSSF